MLVVDIYKVEVIVYTQTGAIDLATPDILVALTMTEVAGGNPPLGTLELSISNPDYIKILQEQNKLFIKFSLNSDPDNSSVAYQGKIISVFFPRAGKNKMSVLVSFSGDYLGFFRSPHTRIFKDGSTIGTIQKVLTANKIRLVTDIISTQDRQNWVQASSSDSTFVGDMLKTMNLGLRYAVYGLGFNREAYIYSSDFYLNGAPILIGESSGMIPYVSVSEPRQDTFSANVGGGYGQEWATVDIDNGDTSYTSTVPNTSNYLTTDKRRVADLSVLANSLGVYVKTANQHKDYIQSAINNLINVSILSAFTVAVQIKNLPQIKLLSHVRLSVSNMINPLEQDVALSGDYVVIGKQTSLSGSEITIDLTLGRQALNYS